jgi:hypothetical protein
MLLLSAFQATNHYRKHYHYLDNKKVENIPPSRHSTLFTETGVTNNKNFEESNVATSNPTNINNGY